MARKPQLPGEIVRQIDSINRSAGEKFQTGDVMGSLRDALSAWELIPDVAWEDIVVDISALCGAGAGYRDPLL